MFFLLASMGLPGLGNFVGEFLVVLGAYRVNGVIAVIAAFGFVLSTVYSLRMMERVFFGEKREGLALSDLSARELGMMIAMAIPLLWLGLYPQTFIDKAGSRFPIVTKSIVGDQVEESPQVGPGWRQK